LNVSGLTLRLWKKLRRNVDLASVLLCLLAALAGAVPEIRLPAGVAIETLMSDGDRGEHDGLAQHALSAQADEREEVSEPERRFNLQVGGRLRLAGAPLRLVKPVRYSGSHYPTGPPKTVI
jgi:hypothetical protein